MKKTRLVSPLETEHDRRRAEAIGNAIGSVFSGEPKPGLCFNNYLEQEPACRQCHIALQCSRRQVAQRGVPDDAVFQLKPAKVSITKKRNNANEYSLTIDGLTAMHLAVLTNEISKCSHLSPVIRELAKIVEKVLWKKY